MKVLVIINDISQGGGEKLLVSSLPIFKKKNIDINVLLLNAANSVPSFLAHIKNAGITIHDLKISNFYNPICAFEIWKFLKANRFDVVHVHLFPASYWSSLAIYMLKTKPVLIFTEHSNHNTRRDKQYFRPLEKAFYRPYNAIIAITDSVKEKLSEWIGQGDKIKVINNGVDLTTIANASKVERQHLCAELNIPTNSKLILMAAGFRYPKDQATLIRACALLGEDFHLLLAGEGEAMEATQKIAAECEVLERIHYLGFRTDISSLMKSVDLNVLSSEYEGMSGVTLESLAANVPFLGSDVNGIKEIVPSEDFLFKPADSQVLASKVRAILDNPDASEAMVKAAKSFVKNFDLEFMVDKYISLYQSLLKK